MKIEEYSHALSKLPSTHKSRLYDDVHDLLFKGKLILSVHGEKPMIYENGAWKEFQYT